MRYGAGLALSHFQLIIIIALAHIHSTRNVICNDWNKRQLQSNFNEAIIFLLEFDAEWVPELKQCPYEIRFINKLLMWF